MSPDDIVMHAGYFNPDSGLELSPAEIAEGWTLTPDGTIMSPPATGILDPNSGLPIGMAPDPASPYVGTWQDYAGFAAGTLGVIDGVVNENPYTLGAGALGMAATAEPTLTDLGTLMTPTSWTGEADGYAGMMEVGMGNAAGQPLPEGSVIFDYNGPSGGN
ncbi:hypothetical protein [Roseicella sp. DB1501]|uniref:hypothetical protein n=1 Tax=Roseicella sp. DB1501 TaxID=2730925 RepID=UPI001491DCEB|nr:hypothetical protein [Roseicella sp. DB1501]